MNCDSVAFAGGLYLRGCTRARASLRRARLRSRTGHHSSRIVKQVNPQYPDSRGVRVEGSVIIALIVTSKGIPKAPRVLKSLDKDLDESAIAAVKQWRFTPAQKDAKPVAVRVSLQIQFHSL